MTELFCDAIIRIYDVFSNAALLLTTEISLSFLVQEEISWFVSLILYLIKLTHSVVYLMADKLMEVLFKLPLTECEEQCLQHYLSVSADPTAAELLVLHLLQRAQYVPAIRLNDRMKHRATVSHQLLEVSVLT